MNMVTDLLIKILAALVIAAITAWLRKPEVTGRTYRDVGHDGGDVWQDSDW